MRFFTHLCFTLLLSGMALPLSAEVDFSGKTIEWVIPFKQGGGSDTWARFNAPFLSKHLPGNPEIVIRNVIGGGSTKGANRYASSAKADGLTILGTSASTQFPYLLGDPRVRYDYDQWKALMVYPTGGVVYIRPELGITSADQLGNILSQRMTFASQGTTSMDLVPLLAFKIIGLNVRPIFGVRGREAGRLAFERGDANIDFQTTTAYFANVKPLVESGDAIPLFTLGALDQSGNLVRDPALPDLPNLGEVYEQLTGKKPAGVEWESWYAFFSAGFGAQKLLVVPSQTPADIVQTYQAAIQATLSDPEYLKTKDSVFGAYNQVSGVTADRLYDLATKIPKKRSDWIRSWLRETYKLNR